MIGWTNNQNPNRSTRSGAMQSQSPRGYDARVSAIETKLLAELEGQVDDLLTRRKAASALHDPLPLTQARRQLSHVVGAPGLCSRKLCRRTKACCGEPMQCLAVFLPLLPAAKITELLLDSRKTRRGRAR